MLKNQDHTWRCSICGFLHYGDTPPDTCPICHAQSTDFKSIDIPLRPERRDPGEERVLIIGAGIAGVSAAASVRAHAPQADIKLISREATYPYMRLNLTRLLAGEFDEANLPLHPESWYTEQRIDLLLGVSATSLNLAEKSVELSEGESAQFDRLIVTTGSSPFIPAIPGADLPQVHSVRTIDDVHRILQAIDTDSRVACIGGGILGLETAGALAKQGASVTVIESFNYLMPVQLNAQGSRVLNDHLETLSIEVITGTTVASILGKEKVEGIRLKDDRTVAADMVIIATGDRAETALLQETGLSINRGILVDNFLRTSHPDIYAAGDVAEHDGIRYGSWNPAMYMGKIAGMNAAGVPTEFGGIPRSHLLKVVGKPMFSIGTITPQDGSYRVIEDYPDNGYRMFLLRDRRMIGCLLIGRLKLMKAARKAVQAKADLSPILTPDTTAEEVAEHLSLIK